jgi:hypothetical protein
MLGRHAKRTLTDPVRPWQPQNRTRTQNVILASQSNATIGASALGEHAVGGAPIDRSAPRSEQGTGDSDQLRPPLCPQTHPTGPGSLSDRSTRQTPQSLDRRALVGSCACGAATPSRTGRPARPAADTHDQASSQRPCPPAEGSPTDGPAKPSRSDERALARYARSKPPHPGPRGRAHHRLVGPATHSGRTSPPPTVANPARRSPPVDSPMVAGLREVSPSPRRRGPRDGLRPLLAPPPRSVPSPPPADA